MAVAPRMATTTTGSGTSRGSGFTGAHRMQGACECDRLSEKTVLDASAQSVLS